MSDPINFRPLGTNVLLQRENPKTVTDAGIIIPETARVDQNVVAVVRAVGTDEAVDVNVGDRVLLDHWHGNAVTIEGAEYLVVDHERILAVFT